MKNNRNVYFDFLRGIAIIMVVCIHTFPESNFNTVSGSINIAFRQLVGCAVPVFLAISGFFLGRKKIANRSEYFAFLRKQIPKVYIPCLVWSLPLFAWYLYLGNTNHFASVAKLVTCGFSVYYFIALIIQYYTLLPLLNKINTNGGVILMCVISIISVSLVSYIE